MTAILENLPFLSGKESLVRSVARWHEWATHKEPNNWQQLLEASDRALEIVGREIAEAKTAAAAATAGLRWQTYDAGRNQMIATLLGIAQKRLQQKPTFNADIGRAIGLMAFGKDTMGGSLKAIPISHWEAGSMDWERSILTVPGDLLWHGIRILDLFDLNGEAAADLLDQAEEDIVDKSGGPGRPTSMHLVEMEFRRRAAAGEIERNLKDECDHLAVWLERTYPTMPRAKSKTIENNIRSAFKNARN